MALISSQTKRLLERTLSSTRERTILNISNRYRHAILDYFNQPYGFSDRMYYRPLSRSVYAGY